MRLSRRQLLSALAGAPVAGACGERGFLDLVSVGPTEARTVRVPGGTIHAQIGLRGQPVSLDAFEAWIERAARMTADYCGRFPVPNLHVRIITGTLGSIVVGDHWRGRLVHVIAGQDTRVETLASDWILVHEMLHAAFPRLARRHLWMREGLSTYLESVTRARAGVLSERQVWSNWVRRMPLGLPRAGARGLDHDRGWARTYWGGALFWLLVDVELREQSGGARSLRDVVRGVLHAGGDARARWSMGRLSRVIEQSVGSSIVTDRYRALALRAGAVDLPALFRRLGVRTEAGPLELREDAPLSSVRRAINATSGLQLPPIPRRRGATASRTARRRGSGRP